MARYSSYDTAGGIWTYKALIDWSVTDILRVRGGYQLANRAPNTAELYLGSSTSVVGFAGGDPCLVNTLNTWGNLREQPQPGQGGGVVQGHQHAERLPECAVQRRSDQALWSVRVQLPVRARDRQRQSEPRRTKKPRRRPWASS